MGRAAEAMSVSVLPRVPIETKPCGIKAVYTPSPSGGAGKTRKRDEEAFARTHLYETGEGKLWHHALARLVETSLGENHLIQCNPFWNASITAEYSRLKYSCNTKSFGVGAERTWPP